MTAAGAPPASLGDRLRRRQERAGWLPSPRSAVVALAIAAAAGAVYLVAWKTPAFAIRDVEIEGVSGSIERRVRAALRPIEGTNLLSFDSADGRRLLAPVPYVDSARFDRSFPNTLRVHVTPERPVALLRRGRDAWVVAASGRVLRRVRTAPLPSMTRVWLPASSEPIVGAVLSETAGAAAVEALVPMRDVGLPGPIRSIRVDGGEVSIVLASGMQVLLGVPSELRLKLAVVARVLPLAGSAAVVDASVPGRVVVQAAPYPDPQVEG